MRSCFKAVQWYYEHLGGQKPIIILTENQQFIEGYKNKRLEIFVSSLGDYLQQVPVSNFVAERHETDPLAFPQKFWPNLQDMYNVYESTRAALSEKSSNDSKKVRTWVHAAVPFWRIPFTFYDPRFLKIT
jgi:DIS3-like exonuclease 1